MFQRFHEMRERREGGFTLIELLVVILIVAILAAVAIPVFLRQREKGYRDQIQSSLKNAATSQESFATGNNGTYTTVVDNGAADDPSLDLADEGWNATTSVTLTIESASGAGYCMQATHGNLPATEIWRYDSAEGEPLSGACTTVY